MIKKDDIIISLVEGLRSLTSYISPPKMKLRHKMRSLPKVGMGKDLYVILNAPSLKTQDLSALKGKVTMFVNRGFMHPLYKDLQPTYHVFIDTKMIKGIWPITWIEEIHQLSPSTIILLPLAWSSNSMFDPYRNYIYWLNWNLPFYNLGVSGACFSFGIQQHFDRIFFTGFDATGIAHEIVKTSDSHFYGDDKELEGRSTESFAMGLYMHSRHLHDLKRLADYCRKRNIKVVNLTNGGLLDMFPREELLPVLKI